MVGMDFFIFSFTIIFIISMDTFDEYCDDPVSVLNEDNTPYRWSKAISEFSDNNTKESSPRPKSEQPIAVKAVIDESGSMRRSKMIAVKLGLCAMVAILGPTDKMSIASFNQEYSQRTIGFESVLDLRHSLPCALSSIYPNGGTSFFDAVVKGIEDMRHMYNPPVPVVATVVNDVHATNNTPTAAVVRTHAGWRCNSWSCIGSARVMDPQEFFDGMENGELDRVLDDGKDGAVGEDVTAEGQEVTVEEEKKMVSAEWKNVIIVLTDGADNSSTDFTCRDIMNWLLSPGFDNFMFLVMAVDMDPNETSKFNGWVELSHAKLVKVEVNSGKTLFAAFKENLLYRIFNSSITSSRFYTSTSGVILRAPPTVATAVVSGGLDVRNVDHPMRSNIQDYLSQFVNASRPGPSYCVDCNLSDAGDSLHSYNG